ncbi:MAG: CBS domain-containing protein [Syntrophomonas sp.]|uniref:CBS domain-containing protein n=1 Tax=Syntrophomonas sp. TaxID=2053627 RepID=UPI00345A8710|nr:CBS domain-containing protein [Syntrophomonas sp.]MDD3879477.1 CBS domain-containing protein [Syntrophomonas sp.]MDD4625640.1 CBS domain-containing protein [Syntrophomonas sp.]
MLAKDIMTREVIAVNKNDSLEEVARILLEEKISGVPVIDADRHVIGIVTEKDLIVKASELKMPFYVTLFDSIIFLENPIRFNKELKKFTASQVEDAMTTKVILVEEDTEVTRIVEIMQDKRVNRVPVVRHGKLVGIISRNDILKSLVKKNG